MVLDLAAAAINKTSFSQYWLRVAAGAAGILLLRTLAQGRKTTRDRDLHARVVVITGAFTPLGLTLVQSLAERGAHIIALSSEPVTSPRIDLLINALRDTTKNEKIFAEECDLVSPRSVRDFCTKFLTGSETRIDALVFAHEYAHIGSFLPRPTLQDRQVDGKKRTNGAIATFHMVTLLLPALLVAPTERDIRIVSVVNPFYAAGVPGFKADEPFAEDSDSTIPNIKLNATKLPILVQEGRRALRTAILMRHLQRVLDALPNRSQVPATDNAAQTSIPVVSGSQQRSNIVAVAVSPGYSQSDTVAHILGASRDGARRSAMGLLLYIVLQPFLLIFAKSSWFAMQSVLHALFLPTPFKSTQSTQSTAERVKAAGPLDELPDEALKPGALYAECAVVRVNVPRPPSDTKEEDSITTAPNPTTREKQKDEKKDEKGKGKEKATPEKVGNDMPTMAEDNEMGGVVVGTMVWECFERGLKLWEASEPPLEEPTEKKEVKTKPAAGAGTST